MIPKQGNELVEVTTMAEEITNSSGNVFEDLGFEKEEAENLKIRSKLMMSLERFIREKGLKQEEAAELFGVTQPRISNLVNGKIGRFSIDMLVNMHTKAGMHVVVDIEPDGKKPVAA